MGSLIVRSKSIRIFSMEASRNKNLQKNSQDLDDFKTRITEEIKIIKKETLPDYFWTYKRLNFCIIVKGITFEQYLWN